RALGRNLHRHEPASVLHEKELAAVGSPPRPHASGSRNPPFGARGGIVLDIDLRLSRLVRDIGDEAAVRGKLRFALVGRRREIRSRLPAGARHRPYPDVAFGFWIDLPVEEP